MNSPTRLQRLSEWAAELRPTDVPERVRALAGSQILSQSAAIRAGAVHPLGARLIRAFGRPTQDEPRSAAVVMAGLGSWLNLDDTAYAGHLSSSTVAVPLAFARARRGTGAELVTAVVAANECASRITAAATLGPLRGQSALHTHLAGTVAGRLRFEKADAGTWTDAFGLALSTPPWPLMRAFLASDARLMCAMTPVRTAIDACDAAHAGLHGAADLVEHPDGFLARFAQVGLPELVDQHLGERWHTETLSFKVHPGGPGIDAAVDCAIELHHALDDDAPGSADRVADVLVEASIYTMYADRLSRRYVGGADSPLGALVLNVGHTVATALLTGGLQVADLEPPRSTDPRRRSLAERVRLVHDPVMTRELLSSEAPFGEALRQAGDAAEPWLRAMGGAELVAIAATAGPGAEGDFSRATKATPARVTVRLRDGSTYVRERQIPEGALGPDLRARHAELMQEKFVAAGGDRWVAADATHLDQMGARALRRWIRAAFQDL